jgi:hypothetical protein
MNVNGTGHIKGSVGKDALIRSGEIENERNCKYNETVRQVTICGAGGGKAHMRKIQTVD